MNHEARTYHAAIVGGGPVGLFLACCLHQAGLSCIVLEKSEAPVTHSRSIGIHPVSLNLFKRIGLSQTFLSAGIKVRRGFAFCNADHVGTINFDACPPPFRFILTLPQFKTERILRYHLNQMDDAILHAGHRVTGLSLVKNGINLNVQNAEGSKKISARYVVGCDGIKSFIRRQAGIRFPGKTYRDTYIMGDFSRNTTFGNDAAIFLCREGVIESFPLSETMRRWVVRTNHYMETVQRHDIEKRVAARIHHNLSSTENTMLSSFGVQKRLAETMVKKRVILAGDAAHVVSPIGGQGMNLGWLDAWDLSRCLPQIFGAQKDASKILYAYSRRRRNIAGKATRRAEFNMLLGRRTKAMFLKKGLLKLALKWPIAPKLARLFTMYGLDSGFI